MRLAAWLRGKRGISIVEEICAVLVLAVAVVALLSTIGFAGGAVSKGNVADRSAAQAQKIADTLIDCLSSAAAEPEAPALETAAGAKKVDSFSDSAGDGGQFLLARTETDGVAGYAVTVRVYYNNGKNYAELRAFAADTGGAFNG